MTRLLNIFVITLLMSVSVNAQNKALTLEEIWAYKFYPSYMNALNSMNGDYYSVLEKGAYGRQINKYSYKTLEKVETILDSKELSNSDFSSYAFNKDESKLLLGFGLKSIYRRSTKGSYQVYDMATKKTFSLLSDEVQEPMFSPDGKKIAYVRANNIYIENLETGKLIQVTKDGKFNHIINGVTDWVYEEEFSFVRAFEWSKDSQFIAYLKFDETAVPEFSMNVTGKELYPSLYTFKYPKAGERNAEVSLYLYDLSKQTSQKIDLGAYEYIPRLQWTVDDKCLSVITLNRHQNDLKLFFVDVTTGKSTLVLNEKDKAYVGLQDNLTFLDDNSFIWTSERDGYNHIYLYDKYGKLVRQITKGDWDVTKYYGLNKTNDKIYYQSVENGSINRGVYAIDLKGTHKELLTPKNGQSEASFSKNMRYFINRYSSSEVAPMFSLYENGKKLRTILDNKDLEEKLSVYKLSEKEFSTIEINGNELNMWMIKPKDFDSNKKYPLLLYQYSGPGSQEVSNQWNTNNDYWHQLLAQKGIIIACVDGRGTGFKGRDFKKVTQKQLGKYEVEDQIAVAKKLAELPYVDGNRIGIWGWSFGGFMSTNCLLKGSDIFKMAIAVAPVTSWRFYDSVYTERYMTTPQENPEGYDDNSPINYADKLKGKYLLIHGSGDDNVHLQNTNRMINALIRANKDFDSEIYPDRTHGIYRGVNTRLHLFRKMTRFIEENLIK